MCLQHSSTMCLIQGQGSKQLKSCLNLVSGNQNPPPPKKKDYVEVKKQVVKWFGDVGLWLQNTEGVCATNSDGEGSRWLQDKDLGSKKRSVWWIGKEQCWGGLGKRRGRTSRETQFWVLWMHHSKHIYLVTGNYMRNVSLFLLSWYFSLFNPLHSGN